MFAWSCAGTQTLSAVWRRLLEDVSDATPELTESHIVPRVSPFTKVVLVGKCLIIKRFFAF